MEKREFRRHSVSAEVGEAAQYHHRTIDLGERDAGLTDAELDMEADSALDATTDMAVDAARDAEVETDAEPDASGPVACQPALSISPAERAARPLDLLTFRPSGGSGSWRFELTQNRSGALLNETTSALDKSVLSLSGPCLILV